MAVILQPLHLAGLHSPSLRRFWHRKRRGATEVLANQHEGNVFTP